MTIKDYFQARIEIIGVPITVGVLEKLTIANGLDAEEDFTNEGKNDADKVFHKIIFDILASPNISEDDFSISYNKDGLITWYKIEAKRLGVPDALSELDSTVEDASYLS